MMLHAPSRLHERPIDADDSIALETLERFRERQVTRARFLVEPDFAEVGPALGWSDSHDAMVFQKRLEMPVRFWFLPQSVNLGLAAFLNDDGEARF